MLIATWTFGSNHSAQEQEDFLCVCIAAINPLRKIAVLLHI